MPAYIALHWLLWTLAGTAATVGQKANLGRNTAVKSGSFLYGIRNYGVIMGVKICFSCFMELSRCRIRNYRKC